MEGLEKDILAILEADSRISAARLAAMLGVSEEQAKAEVKKLEESGVIVKYTAIVNSDAVDENKVEALIEVKVTPQKGEGFEAIEREIAAHG